MIKKMNSGKLLVALVLAIAAVVGFNFYSGVSAQTDEVKAVTDVLTKEAVAVEKGDLAALDKIWANSEDVTVFESGHANYGWADYRNSHLAPELKEFKNTKYAFSDLKVKVDGKTAWATFKYALAADIGTRNIQSGGLGTAILEKRDGRWQIVHWHSSAPRRAPAASPSPKPAAPKS
ncbi:MAG: nuclear transport factor 2 family protein [Acidobacteriota bacterium]|nr:nuclear transport factor 2 family protein [Acidobacteriota bacterium]